PTTSMSIPGKTPSVDRGDDQTVKTVREQAKPGPADIATAAMTRAELSSVDEGDDAESAGDAGAEGGGVGSDATSTEAAASSGKPEGGAETSSKAAPRVQDAKVASAEGSSSETSSEG